MPTIIIEAVEGRSLEQKRGLVRDITEAVVKNYKVPPEVVRIILHENTRAQTAEGGKLMSDK